MTRSPGDLLLGRFRLLRVLGEHGVSQSWLAEDAELRESVVLRLLAPELAASQLGHERLREACRQARRLHHPQIVPVHDFHRDGALCFVSREYVEAADPVDALPPELRTARLAGVADALAYAHGLGVVHGDLKSAKVIWALGGVPRLADFCVSAELNLAARALGPPSADPEPAPPAPEDDVQGLGAVLFEVWTGEAPLASDRTHCVSRMEACGAPPNLARLVEEMLAPSPGDRPDLSRVRAVLDPGAAMARPTPLPAPAARDDIVAVPVQRRSPPPVPPPRAAPGPSVPRVFVLATFAILLALALGVFVYLPRLVNAPADGHPAATGEAAKAAKSAAGRGAAEADAASATGAPESSDEAARRLLAEVLALHETLLGQGVRQWAPKEMSDSEADVEEGQRLQLEGDLAEAVARYTSAKSAAEKLSARAPEVLARTLAAGSAALDAGEDEEAARQFALALEIDPENAEAAAGAARAGSLDALSALLARASQHEAAGELAEARARYVEARDLDPASTRAKEGIARMDARLGEIAYGRGMSGATRALAAGDFESALRSVKAALAARPGSAEASALRARIEAGRKRSQAELHQSRGLALERDGSWALAVDEYRKSLAIDPDAAAAQQGLARSEQGLRLSRSFAEWIAAPDRLIDPRVRTQASELLAAARAFPSAGDELRAQARQVEALVARYSQPVRVVFESDDQTEVTIQRLSKLGSFTRREVELDPGTYVVIGIRRGYRDVRETITVAPGEASPRVVIRCTQPI